MADGTRDEVLLCCLLWASPGQTAGLTAYEDAVLELMPEHGGEVVQRAKSDGAEGRADEIQFLRFPGQAAVDAFVNDSRRLALADERDRVVARTEVFPVEFL